MVAAISDGGGASRTIDVYHLLELILSDVLGSDAML